MTHLRRFFYLSMSSFLVLFLLVGSSGHVYAEEEKMVPHAPDRKSGEGEGPFSQLIIQGATMIDGTGAPPQGPVDIVIEGNKIKKVGSLNGEIPEGAQVIDASGMYVLPGFVDTHAHIGGLAQGVSAEYVYKLWMAHGVTTVREPGSFNGIDWTLEEKERSEKNEIVAPRIYAYVSPGDWDKGELTNPEDARKYVRWAGKKGANGFKLREWDPPIMEALIDEAEKEKLGTTTHLVQTVVSADYIPNMAEWGLGSVEHWYGLPEALFDDQRIQDFTADYNYNNEYDRFSQAGRLWQEAAPPGSEKWNEVMDELLDQKLTMSPTFTIYEATRDQMRVRNEEWHEKYTSPSLQEFYEPSAESHGSFFFDWTTTDEVAWKENYKLWMEFINEYKNRGGRVTTGSDSGFIYRTYGFGYVRELELLQEAGFHPLEVIQAATMNGAELLSEENGEPMEFGMIRPGMLADLVLIEENPLHNFKYLYGTGALRLNEEEEKVERVGGVNYTIKDGIVYDAKQLLADVEKMVADEKENSPNTPTVELSSSSDRMVTQESNGDNKDYSLPASSWFWLFIPMPLVILGSVITLKRRRDKE